MLNKNNIPTGILIGLILPVLSGVLFELVMNNVWVISRRGIPYFVVVAINLIILRIFAAKHQEKTAQGIMVVTFIFMVLVYFFRFR
jgi:predicted Na+-dependent transporter